MLPVRWPVVGLTAADLNPLGAATVSETNVVVLAWEFAAPLVVPSSGNANKTIPTTSVAVISVACRRMVMIGTGFL